MIARILRHLAIGVATVLATLPMFALTDGRSSLFGVIVLAAVTALAGAFAALLRAPAPAAVVFQAPAAVGAAFGLATRYAPEGLGFLDAPTWLVRDLVDVIQSNAAPLPDEPSVAFMVILSAMVTQLGTEFIASTLEQPAWSLSPLALPFSAAAVVLEHPIVWPSIAAVLGAWVLMLLTMPAHGTAHLARHASRPLPFHLARHAVAAGAVAAALGIAFLLAPAVPVRDTQPWQGGNSGPIELTDPTVTLYQHLRRPTDQDVLTYRTADGRPTYLRTVALPSLTTDGAHLVPMELRNRGLERAYDAPGEPIEVDVQFADVSSEYLPVPFAVDSFDADGLWAYDPATLSVVATGPDRAGQTRGLHYTATATAPVPNRGTLAQATAGSDDVDPLTTQMPGVDPEVRSLAQQVVATASTDGAKALAIQDFLRSQEFAYSLDAPTSPSMDTISAFLLEHRTGYCIHFASAMITMARAEGIPARMAIGFNAGKDLGDGSFRVGSHNMHAWPELYFDELGWVPFEPTPSVATVPQPSDEGPSASPSPSPSPSPAASETSSELPSPDEGSTPSVAPSASPSESPAVDADGPTAPSWLLPVLAVLGLAVLLLVTPMLIRTALLRYRLRAGQESRALAAAVWREVRDTRLDVGAHLPEGSPRRAVAELDDDTALLEDIATTVERALYARASDTSGLVEQVLAFRREALQGAPWWVRWWPRSLWSR